MDLESVMEAQVIVLKLLSSMSTQSHGWDEIVSALVSLHEAEEILKESIVKGWSKHHGS